MATPSEKLAASLDVLRVIQEKGIVAIKGDTLSRTHKERLLKSGLKINSKEIFKGMNHRNHEKPIGCSSNCRKLRRIVPLGG